MEHHAENTQEDIINVALIGSDMDVCMQSPECTDGVVIERDEEPRGVEEPLERAGIDRARAVVVATNDGGPSDIIANCHNGMLVDPFDGKAIEKALLHALLDHLLEGGPRVAVPPEAEDGELAVDQEALGVYVTHLAEDLSPLPDAARIDGIFAEGLTADLELEVDYQPRFGTVGKSTPEFIVSRLVANARGRAERQGFEALAGAVGEEAVQRTLSDVRWREN